MPPEYQIHLSSLQEYCLIEHGDRYEYLHSNARETLLDKFKETVSASENIEEITMEDFSKAFSRRFPDPSGIKIRVYNGLGYVYHQNGDLSLRSVFSKGKMDDFLYKKKMIEERKKKGQEERDRRRQQALNEENIKNQLRKYLKKD